MAKQFQATNKHVSYTKSQIQDKEKELKREYKMLKDARMQSGAGWCEESCKIQADKALWDNLYFPKIGKFKKNPFPLFDLLGDLYDGQLAEGKLNFTSTSQPSETGGEFENTTLVEDVPNGSEDEEVRVMHQMGTSQMRDEVNARNEVPVQVVERVDNGNQNEKKVSGVPKKKPMHESKKSNKSDDMVQVVDRYVKMKEKQADDEKAETNAYSIAKRISALQNMRDKFSGQQRVKASKIFKNAENRETFLSWVAEDEQLAVD